MKKRYKSNRRQVECPWSIPHPIAACIICGTTFLCMPFPGEKEEEEEEAIPVEWTEKLKKGNFNIAAKELEEMPFPAHSYVPMSFCRAILDKPGHPLKISGISRRLFSLRYVDQDPVPLDPLKARIGFPARLGNQYSAEYFFANMFGPDNFREKGRRVGYTMHMPCWVILCRLVEKCLIEENLDCFVAIIRSFWASRPDEWDLDIIEDYDDSCFGIMPWSERAWIWPEYDIFNTPDYPEHWEQVDARENPGVISDIQQLIADAHLAFNDRRQAVQGDHPVYQTPLEIAVMIVDLIRKEPGFGLDGVRDTRNMLFAFQWSLPVSYWQSRCRNRLVFEIDDVIEAGIKVDWQLICLGLEELLFDHHWYFKGGLRNRGRIMQLVDKIKESFLDRLEAGDAGEVNSKT